MDSKNSVPKNAYVSIMEPKMRSKKVAGESGFTLVELTVTVVVIGIVTVSIFGLFVSLVNSTLVAKHRAVALTLATNQMEYLKSLPYDSLAVQGGSIYATTLLPATKNQTVNGFKYITTTSISYVDDAYDGCGNYPSETLKQTYCRNYPSPAGAPSPDLNPADYKIAHVVTTDRNGKQLAAVDTEISARVSETASTTGALFVNVIDQSGAPLSGATVTVVNNTVNPVVNLSDSTDQNGIAIFYGLPPDNKTDYVITGSKAGYSTLTTINSFGSLQPTYPNQMIVSQQPSYVTLMLKQQGVNSLLIETTTVDGNQLGGVAVYLKGGYKSYTSSGDTTYYYDTLTPSDTRPTTNEHGFATLQNLVPGPYIFCGDSGEAGCSIGSTKYYLAAAVPYGGTNSLNPIVVPIYDPSNPPATTFNYNSVGYLQEVRLMLTSNANFPRVFTLSPDSLSLASADLSNFQFTIGGQKLSCGTSGTGCSSTVKFVQGSNNYTASCTGGTGGTQLSCSVNLTGLTSGTAQLVVGTNGGTLTLPFSPQLGGLNVSP